MHSQVPCSGPRRCSLCGNALTHGDALDTTAPMPASTSARLEAALSLFGMALWRLAAAVLYVGSLLLTSHDLPDAVLVLLAALVCLPGARAALRERTGIRVGGMAAASGAVLLMLCAVLRAGWEADAPMPSAGATGAVVASALLVGKP